MLLFCVFCFLCCFSFSFRVVSRFIFEIAFLGGVCLGFCVVFFIFCVGFHCFSDVFWLVFCVVVLFFMSFNILF